MPDTAHKWFSTDWVYDVPPLSVDADEGAILGAAIVTEGEAKGHGVSLDSTFVADVVRLGNEKSQGVKVRFGHPSMSSTALGTFLGRAKNFRTDGNMARADVFVSNEAANSPSGDLKKYVLGIAANESDMFGMSIVFEPGESYQLNDDGTTGPPGRNDGPVFASIEKLHAADMVDDPAANNGLFSSWNSDTLAAQVSEFLDTHPEVLDLLAKDPSVLDSFVARYRAYVDRKEGASAMATEDTHTPAVAEVDEPTPERVDGELEEELEAETETDTTADTVDVPAEQPEPSETFSMTEFSRMVAAFGAQIAADTLAAGGGYADAQTTYVTALTAENARLRAEADAPEPTDAVAFDAEPDAPAAVDYSTPAHLQPMIAAIRAERKGR